MRRRRRRARLPGSRFDVAARALLPSDRPSLAPVPALIGYFGGILAAVAAIVFLRRRHVRRRASRRAPRVGDAEIRHILERGRVEVDDPLDLEEIREEEKKFWEEERWE